MTNKEILKEYKDDDLAIDAERTPNGIMLSEEDVLVLMGLANKNILTHFITWYNAKPKMSKGKMLSIQDCIDFLKD